MEFELNETSPTLVFFQIVMFLFVVAFFIVVYYLIRLCQKLNKYLDKNS